MYSGSYTSDGVKGLLKEGGTARRDETTRIVESLGGKLEAYYWCYGSTDFLAIMDFPDHTTVTGMALNIAASGKFKGFMNHFHCSKKKIDCGGLSMKNLCEELKNEIELNQNELN